MPKTRIELDRLKPEMASAAQAEYDAWEQDEDGIDVELGGGGICHLIADRISGILSGAGFEAVTTHSEGIGENHVWVTARTDSGVVTVDIPPGVYEIGSGYVWQKKANVKFGPDDVEIAVIDSNPANFATYAGEDYEESLRP
jgi:hypothetical protein